MNLPPSNPLINIAAYGSCTRPLINNSEEHLADFITHDILFSLDSLHCTHHLDHRTISLLTTQRPSCTPILYGLTKSYMPYLPLLLTKAFIGKVGQEHATKMFGKCPSKLDDEILPRALEFSKSNNTAGHFFSKTQLRRNFF